MPSNIDETAFDGIASLPERVVQLATAKAALVAGAHPEAVIIGADTLVDLNGSALGKPGNGVEALAMLQRLSGTTHHVHTGVALMVPQAHPPVRVYTAISTTSVRFRKLTDEQYQQYIRTGEPMGKAGAYGIQGLGGALIEAYAGCFTNVVGLPVCQVMSMLHDAGVWTEPFRAEMRCRPPRSPICEAASAPGL